MPVYKRFCGKLANMRWTKEFMAFLPPLKAWLCLNHVISSKKEVDVI